jgi:hypothetical protein
MNFKNNILSLAKKTAVCFSFLSSFSLALAESPTLKISGFTAINGVFSNQRVAENGKGGSQPHIAIGASNLYFKVTGKSSNDTVYKFNVVMDASPGASNYISQNYVEFANFWGILQLGCLNGPSDTMVTDAARLVGGANGIDGAFGSVYNMSAGVIDGFNNTLEPRKSTKIVYYTPTVGGFQLGFSYTPNTSNSGRNGMNNSSNAPSNSGVGYMSGLYPNKDQAPWGVRNVAVGLTYKNEFKYCTLNLAAIGLTEKTRGWNNTPMQSGNAYNLSAAVEIGKWTIASGFLNNGKSRLPLEAKTSDAYLANKNSHLGDAGKAWNVGGSYVVGAYQFAAVYHNTNRKTDANGRAGSDIYTATVDFTALEGLKIYAEADYIISKTNSRVIDDQQKYYDSAGKGQKAIGRNRGTVFIIGTKVSF